MPMPNFNSGALFEIGRKTQEAFAVQHGIDVPRFYSDAELEESRKLIESATEELYGVMTSDERIASPERNEKQAAMLSFRVTAHNPVTLETRTTSVKATHWCRAYIKALEKMYPDSEQKDTAAGGIELSYEILPPTSILRRVK